ncbi:hypothetical protein RHSIM_Rhsim01G0019800 [Rhododendron simsii]|uniref:Mitochondrial protein n=1 Tax=Rhododendron simsii TaxID=118357 RepID=A0A834HPY4_RHOSS|nr:hypothetical protein RHSIM_Rhsim01G0019800 [Rhododendron simsii]
MPSYFWVILEGLKQYPPSSRFTKSEVQYVFADILSKCGILSESGKNSTALSAATAVSASPFFTDPSANIFLDDIDIGSSELPYTTYLEALLLSDDPSPSDSSLPKPEPLHHPTLLLLSFLHHLYLMILLLIFLHHLYLMLHRFVVLLGHAGITDNKTASTPLEPATRLTPLDGSPLPDATRYRQLVGSLVYLTVTRPDIAYAIHIVSQSMCASRSTHFDVVLRILRYVKGTHSMASTIQHILLLSYVHILMLIGLAFGGLTPAWPVMTSKVGFGS